MDIKNYFKQSFVFDLRAGLITGVVALPLAIAFAIASGVEPVYGIYTAIIAGILTSLTGGSVFSITGPTGAMTVIILSTLNKHGLEGLMLAGFLAGLFQILIGSIGLGKLMKFIPLPIVSGFTAGIGVLILIGQIPNFLGLSIPSKEHAWQTIIEILKNLNSFSMIAVSISIFTIILLVFLPKILRKFRYVKMVPASMFALVLSTAAVFILKLQVPKVGIIKSQLPSFHLINFNFALVQTVLPAAVTIAILGAIESLLCAVVCDGMTNTRHNSSRELIAQGATNVVLPFFSGIPATAAVARSAVNIQEGAKTRASGMIHGLFLLSTLLFLGPVAQYIPKSFLAGILMFVSFRMINFHEFKTILSISRSETLVLFITFLLTVFTDLVFAVQVGMLLALFLLAMKFSKIVDIKYMEQYDPHNEINSIINSDKRLKNNIGVYTMNGPFFFGAMNIFERKLNQHMHINKPYIIIRMKHVEFIDSTAVVRLNSFIRERKKKNGKIFLSTLQPKVRKTLFRNPEFNEIMARENIFETTKGAIDYIEKHHLAENQN